MSELQKRSSIKGLKTSIFGDRHKAILATMIDDNCASNKDAKRSELVKGINEIIKDFEKDLPDMLAKRALNLSKNDAMSREKPMPFTEEVARLNPELQPKKEDVLPEEEAKI